MVIVISTVAPARTGGEKSFQDRFLHLITVKDFSTSLRSARNDDY